VVAMVFDPRFPFQPAITFGLAPAECADEEGLGVRFNGPDMHPEMNTSR